MAAPIFGFSIGDFIAIIELAIDVYKACRETGGAQYKSKLVLVELGAYIALLQRLQGCNNEASEEIKELVSICQIPVQEFYAKMKGKWEGCNTSAISTNPVKNTLRSTKMFWRKVEWALFDAEEVERLRTQIAQPLSAIGRLLDLELRSSQSANNTMVAQKLNGPVSDMATDVTPNATAVSVNARSLAAVSWDCNRLDVFGIGGDNAIWTTYCNSPSEKIDWTSIGGYVISPPAVVSTQPHSLDVLVRGRDYAAWVNHFDGTSWSSFKSLDGWFSSALTASSWGPGHLDVFGLGGGVDKEAYRKNFDSGLWSSSWENLGGNWTSDVAAISWGPGRIDIFAIGTDYNMYRKVYSSGSWASWENLGGNFNSPPTVVSWGPGRLDVFGIDNSGALLHKAFDNGGWGGWESLGGTLYSAVSAVTSTFFDIKRIDVFALGSSQTYYRKTWTGTAWTSWVSHGNGNFNTEPLVASRGSNSLDVFGIANDNSVWHEAWNGTEWTPSNTGWENLKGQFIKFS